MRLPFLLIALALSSSETGPRWPIWAEELASHLECGMRLDEIQDLTDRHVDTLDGGHPWLGKHYIRRRHTKLWLQFDSREQLESIILGQPDGWRLMSVRLSPRKNVCTGELAFAIRIVWTYELEGAEVYLDGRKVGESDWADPLLIVPAGSHEIRFEKRGYKPVIKYLDLGPDDRGEQRVDLSEEDLVPNRAAGQ